MGSPIVMEPVFVPIEQKIIVASYVKINLFFSLFLTHRARPAGLPALASLRLSGPRPAPLTPLTRGTIRPEMPGIAVEFFWIP